jgi:serine/threonine protein kinase
MVGTNLGSYTILRKLGEGGMGEVYLAAHRRLARLAAVKVLLPEFSTNAEVVTRFFTEARATSLIDHPGIVEILDCDVLPSGRAYIVMEFLRGESLAACLRRVGDMRDDFPAVLSIGQQMASALAEAHAKGIIHRDLKPDNVHLLKAGPRSSLPRMKILDFGIAKLMEAGHPGSKTRTGSLLGTPLYMSPEQCRSAGSVDARSDIYSLGCILFEMVCGRPPFQLEGFGELIVAHVSEPPPRVSDLQPATPAGLAALIAQMLAKAREERPPSMQVVAEDLQTLLATCPPARTPLIIEEPPEEPIPTLVPTPAPSRPSGRQETALLSNDTSPGARDRISVSGTPNLAGGTRVLQPRTTLSQSSGEVASRTASVGPPRPARGAGLWFALGLVIAAAGGGGAYLALRPPAGSSTPAEGTREPVARVVPTPAPEAAPSPPARVAAPPVRDDTVTIRVNGAPAGTEVTVDGQRGQLPLKLARGGGRHVLQFSAAGYQDERREVESDRDQDLTVELARDHRAAGGRPRHHPTAEGGSRSPGDKGPEPGEAAPAGKKALNPITDL